MTAEMSSVIHFLKTSLSLSPLMLRSRGGGTRLEAKLDVNYFQREIGIKVFGEVQSGQ